jgi:hypothetical protein
MERVSESEGDTNGGGAVAPARRNVNAVAIPLARASRRGLVAAWLMAAAHVVAAAGPTAPPLAGEWNFEVLLDGKPIGEHRFRLEPEGEQSRLTSDARFDMKVLGFTVYRYRHTAVEHWRGACLVSLVSTTDDDGKPSRVQLAAAGEGGAVLVSAAPHTLDGCVMSFAYWHPAMCTQTRLLNAQTGQVEAVQVGRLVDALIDVRGEAVAAHGYRISGASRPVNVWYAADGQWIGLDAIVAGHRKLSYRLR